MKHLVLIEVKHDIRGTPIIKWGFFDDETIGKQVILLDDMVTDQRTASAVQMLLNQMNGVSEEKKVFAPRMTMLPEVAALPRRNNLGKLPISVPSTESK